MIQAFKAVLGGACAVSLFGMMALTSFDVGGRKLFDNSIPGSLEITELLMLMLIFSGLPLVTLSERHVMFDLLDSKLPVGARSVVHRLANLVCGIAVSGAAWLVFERAQRVAEYNDTTANLHIPLAPFTWITGGLLVATALVHFGLMLRGPGENSDSAEVGA